MTATICMATYNGARWVQDQIASIVAQTDEDWRLLISDDGSTDATLELLRKSASQDSRISLLAPRNAQAGVVANFEYLLTEAVEPAPEFIALCDQDDLWDPDKMSVQREQLRTASAACSDPELINARGEPLGQRLLEQLNVKEQPDLTALLAQNSVVGCTLAVRSDVLDLALPFPPGLQNHDWWLALCALSRGQLICDKQALVSYRQHDANVVGAYRPFGQLLQLPRILSRQRAVLVSQLEAVHTLIDRLAQRNLEVPSPLAEYVFAMEEGSFSQRMAAVAVGRFAAPHIPLKVLRVGASLRSLR